MMKLKSGDIVEVIAPSSFPKGNQWKRGLDILQSWGLKPRLGKTALKPWLFHANTNKRRSHFLNQAFLNPSSSAVWMLKGGYGLQKLMPSFIKSFSRSIQNKLFIGYSDGTPLHFYLNSQNRPTWHAPVICELSELPENELMILKNMLLGIKKEIVFKHLKPLKVYTKRTLKAEIIGGNLSLLSSCIGLSWFRCLKPHFLFVEDINEEDYKVDRLLHHLFYSGCLEYTKVILLGSFYPLSRHTIKEKIIKSFSQVCRIPVISALPCGHKPRNHPLPFKIPAKLVIQKNKAVLTIRL